MEVELVRLSKIISRALRHRPESVGITLDRHGWCDIGALVDALTVHGTPITREQLEPTAAPLPCPSNSRR
ncbi:RNA 2'-phosphotransferase [Lysobacter soli]|uniref:RNA 2'-phosphotransferase n=1 Tax=Lysobacter soli TaxID=453783 RepID=UPI003CE55903